MNTQRKQSFNSPTKDVEKEIKTIISTSSAIDSTKSSYIDLRKLQVMQMNAGHKPHLKTQPSTHQVSEETMTKWKNRHPSHLTYSTNYMACQERLIFLADVAPHLRFEVFEEYCFTRNLAPTTAEAYWTTWLSVQKILAIPSAQSDARVTKILKARSTAYPVSFPTPATKVDIDNLVRTFRGELPSFTAIVMFAFINGQRISDMIQLASTDMEEQGNFLKVTIRRGKTMMVSKPYTLWIRKGTYPTEELIELKKASCERLFLFSATNSEAERNSTLNVIRMMLMKTNPDLELRSIRRGGLQRMAQLGFSMQKIIAFSRHADEPMLMRYLGWGQCSTHLRSGMIEVVDAQITGFRSPLKMMTTMSE